ncbi:MAG: type I secretion system permease/ATPase [Sphingomonas sp.]|nr:type I secretion system permease/ATPase [Sphingomonas sp.]
MPHSPVPSARALLAPCAPHLTAAALFSAVSNLLYLTPSIFMLQVYDRVVPTGGLGTLGALAAITVAAYAALGFFQWLRARLLIRAGERANRLLAPQLLCHVLTRAEMSVVDRADGLHDLETVRATMAGSIMAALFDAPWTPIYVAAAFLLHPWLGAFTLLAALILIALAWASDRVLLAPSRHASLAAARARAGLYRATANIGEVRALGMGQALTTMLLRRRGAATLAQAQAGLAASAQAEIAKFARLVLQSAVLALAAVLVVDHALSPGAMIAATLLLARALAPVEQLSGNWRAVIEARAAFRRVAGMIAARDMPAPTTLPAPSGAMSVERLTVAAPDSGRVLIAEVSFAVSPGEVIGVSGPSGSGKSTLLRALAGGIDPARGTVRLDGATIDQYDREALGRAVGYLPQEFTLFQGTVKENIARFAPLLGVDPAAVDTAVVAAAERVGAHLAILRLPEGYDTEIGTGGLALSTGQAQAIALARALFGAPRLLILDEPTAHADADAKRRFLGLLTELRLAQATVIVASHSEDILATTDKVLALDAGKVERFGPLVAPVRTRLATFGQPISFQPAGVDQ